MGSAPIRKVRVAVAPAPGSHMLSGRAKLVRIPKPWDSPTSTKGVENVEGNGGESDPGASGGVARFTSIREFEEKLGNLGWEQRLGTSSTVSQIAVRMQK